VKLVPHDNSAVCRYWLARIDQESARTIAGDEGAYKKEHLAWRELEANLERGSVGASNTTEDGMLEVRTHPASHDLAVESASAAAGAVPALSGGDATNRGRRSDLQQ
jgi:hypothetical protein